MQNQFRNYYIPDTAVINSETTTVPKTEDMPTLSDDRTSANASGTCMYIVIMIRCTLHVVSMVMQGRDPWFI